MKRNNFKIQSGRSMVEMLGVLAIIGVLSVGAIAGYNMAMEKHRLNQALEAVQLVIAEIRSLYASQGNYNGLGFAASKDIPEQGMTVGGDSVAAKIFERLNIKSYYPIAIFRASATNGISADGFYVGVFNVSKSNCVSLYTQNWQSYGNDYAGVGFDGSLSDEVSISEAQNYCEELDMDMGSSVFGVQFNPARETIIIDDTE